MVVENNVHMFLKRYREAVWNAGISYKFHMNHFSFIGKNIATTKKKSHVSNRV